MTHLTTETITEIVQHLEPTWDVRSATPATAGAHLVFHLDVETDGGTRECVLKATPPEREPTCGAEARLLAVLGAHTSLPVPEVLGVVDDHEQWPTPLFLATTLPGTNHDRTELADYPEAAIERLGRSTGRLLAALHRLDVVDSYGFVGVEESQSLDGARPDDDLANVAVREPVDSWTAYLDGEVERVTAAMEDTRFGDLAPAVRERLRSESTALSGPFDPVLARIDQSLDNVVLDPDTAEVTGLLDWEFCVATTPAYDLAFVEDSLAGGHWTLLPDAPDHRETIRAGLRAGYRAAGPDRVVRQARQHHDCYALLAAAHAACHFDSWFSDLDVVDPTDEQRGAAAAALRARLTRSLP